MATPTKYRSIDEYLRSFGWEIRARKNGDEPVWVHRGDCPKGLHQSEAVELTRSWVSKLNLK